MNRPDSPPERHIRAKIEFLHEQKGVPERELTDALIPVLEADPRAQRAYLARVAYEDAPGSSVALCVWTTGPVEPLVRELSAVFWRMFGSDQYLDIVSLTQEQQVALEDACPPFYVRMHEGR